MKRPIYVFFICCLLFCGAEPRKKTGGANTDMDIKKNSATKLFNNLNPYFATINAGASTIKNVASIVHKDSSTTIQEISSQEGFDRLINIGEYMTSSVLKTNLPKLIENWKNRLDKSNIDLSPTQIKTIMDDFDDYELSIVTDSTLIMKQSITYKNLEGNMVYLLYTIWTTNNTDVVNWSKFTTFTNFKIAQKYAIMTRSKCNIIRCKSEDYIKYIDTPITEHHWQTIMKMNLEFIKNSHSLINVDYQPVEDLTIYSS
jgi:hypothetical protein